MNVVQSFFFFFALMSDEKTEQPWRSAVLLRVKPCRICLQRRIMAGPGPQAGPSRTSASRHGPMAVSIGNLSIGYLGRLNRTTTAFYYALGTWDYSNSNLSIE